MEFRILGSLEVADAGRLLRLGGPKQRALLALLLLNANEVVASDRLIDELWGEEAPPTAAKVVQNAVSQLRKLLDGEDGHEPGEGAVTTRDGGYALRVRPGELDLEIFGDRVTAARNARAAGDLTVASAEYVAGLALWRGPVLGGLDFAPTIQAERDDPPSALPFVLADVPWSRLRGGQHSPQRRGSHIWQWSTQPGRPLGQHERSQQEPLPFGHQICAAPCAEMPSVHHPQHERPTPGLDLQAGDELARVPRGRSRRQWRASVGGARLDGCCSASRRSAPPRRPDRRDRRTPAGRSRRKGSGGSAPCR